MLQGIARHLASPVDVQLLHATHSTNPGGVSGDQGASGEEGASGDEGVSDKELNAIEDAKWRRQLELVPRPKCLPHKGGQQRHFLQSPELWSLTVDQLGQFVKEVKESKRYSQLKACIRRSTEWHVSDSVNHYELNDEFIIPWSKNTGSSIALLINPDGLLAQAMISHVTCQHCAIGNASGF